MRCAYQWLMMTGQWRYQVSELWQENIRENQDLVRSNAGPRLVTVVSGSRLDQQYWQGRFSRSSADVFRADGSTFLVSVCEQTRKGNFLGMLNAWARTKESLAEGGGSLPDVSLMCMVFGQGKRLSPFTQSLGNRKAALPVPLRGAISQDYLCTADLSGLYTNNWIQHLEASGFRGLVVKWGDEAVVPGVQWQAGSYQDLDAFRFVWKTSPTEILAREKDWVLSDAAGRMLYQYSRQPLEVLEQRLGAWSGTGNSVGVNLGSVAVSYRFLDRALEVFREDIEDPAKWVDWDPYVWMALFCVTEDDWRAEAERERAAGRRGIHDLGERYPEFFAKIGRLRAAIAPGPELAPAVGVLDFGLPLWADFGLHSSLRRGLSQLIDRSEAGEVSRSLFMLPGAFDARGNLILNSRLPEGADIRDSLILDSVILDERSVVHGAVIVGGQIRRASLPHGGVALFTATDELDFAGPHAMSLRSVAPSVRLPEGGRHTTLFLSSGPVPMLTNEAVVDYEGGSYDQPILGNPLSFKQAATLVSTIDGAELDGRWHEAWRDWLG
jgi:hypothetical protein